MKHFDTITITNVTYPIEFFGNFYFADCPCGVELIGYTKDELKNEMIGHTCQACRLDIPLEKGCPFITK